MDLLACRRVCQRESQKELSIQRTGVGTSCQASSFFMGCLHPACPQQPWEAQRLLSCLLLSTRLISAGSTLLFFLLPWWAGPRGMLVHLPSETCHPSLFPPWLSSSCPAGSPGPMSDVSEQIQSPVLQSECITRQGASARRFGFNNKSPCFHEFKSDFKTWPLMFF